MKKIYIKPQTTVYDMLPESEMMLSVSGGQTTGGFGTNTQAADERNGGWQVESWTNNEEETEE